MIVRSFAELPRKCVEHSNAHDLEEIRKLFLDGARYESVNVGTFDGWKSIAGMMKGFFARIPDAEWHVENYANIEDELVEFTFVLCGTDRETGQRIVRQGIERIRFSDSGRISHIDVR